MFFNRKSLLIFVFSALVFLFEWVLSAPANALVLKPLGIQDARLLEKNQGEMRLGFSFFSDLHNNFQNLDFNRRLVEVPSLTLNLGLGERVEAQFFYSFLYLEQDPQETQWGSGDMTFGFKVRLWERESSPYASAVRLAAKLPNADDQSQLGTDSASIFLEVLGSKDFSHITLFGNLGLAIIGAPPGGGGGQDDLLKYGLGARLRVVPEQFNLLMSVEGMTFEDGLNERGGFYGGFQWIIHGIIWDTGGSFGYTPRSEDWSFQTGLTIPFSIPSHW